MNCPKAFFKIIMTGILCALIAVVPFFSVPASADTTDTIVGVGCSSMNRCDIDRMLRKAGYTGTANIYNFGDGGIKMSTLNHDDNFIDSIVEVAPQVIIIYGSNDLKSGYKNAAVNEQKVDSAYKNTIQLIEKLYDRTYASTGTAPDIIYVSSMKLPGHYRDSGSTTSSCNIWDRMDQLNGKMEAYAEETPYVTYVDVQKYLMYRQGNNYLRFYVNDSEAASAKDLCRQKKVSRYFQMDLKHLSTVGYDKAWRVVGQEVVACLDEE